MFTSQMQQMNYSFMRRINATPAMSLTVFVDFTPLPTASELMNQLDPPPFPIKANICPVYFSMSHCCSPSNHLLSKKHRLDMWNNPFKTQTSLRAAVNKEADG